MRSLLLVLTLILTTTTWAATDPDIDPAHPIAIDAVAEGLPLEIMQAEAFLQISAEGVSYIRIDLEVLNTGEEPIHTHQWHVAFEGVAGWSVTAGTVEPGETRTFSQLVQGKHVEQVAGSLESVALTASPGNSPSLGGGSAGIYILCGYMPTRADCERWAAMTQSFCWGSCIASGSAGGHVSCMESTYEDPNGVKCSIWNPVCLCEGRPTFTDALASGLIDPSDPLSMDAVTHPTLLQMQQSFR